MTSPSSLLALEGKLVEAKEGSRELTIEMMRALGFKWNGHLTIDNGFGRWERSDGEHLADLAFLGSIDSALALVSRCLPGADVCVWTNDRDMAEQRTGPGATLWHDDFEGAVAGVDTWCGGDIHSAATPALSICLILVRALLHQRALKGAGE